MLRSKNLCEVVILEQCLHTHPSFEELVSGKTISNVPTLSGGWGEGEVCNQEVSTKYLLSDDHALTCSPPLETTNHILVNIGQWYPTLLDLQLYYLGKKINWEPEKKSPNMCQFPQSIFEAGGLVKIWSWIFVKILKMKFFQGFEANFQRF